MPKFNLVFCENAKIDTVECSEKERIRDVLIKSGIVRLHDTTLNAKELEFERDARSLGLGFCGSNIESVINNLNTEYRTTPVRGSNTQIHNVTDVPISVRKLIARQSQQQFGPGIKPEITSRLVDYRYSKKVANQIFFANVTTGDTSIYISTDGVLIDYYYLHNFRCPSNRDLRVYLIGIGALGLIKPNQLGTPRAEKHSYYYSQRNHLGMWKENEPGEKKLKLKEPDPPEVTEDKPKDPDGWLMRTVKEVFKWFNSLSPVENFLVRGTLICSSFIMAIFFTAFRWKKTRRGRTIDNISGNELTVFGLIVAIVLCVLGLIVTVVCSL